MTSTTTSVVELVEPSATTTATSIEGLTTTTSSSSGLVQRRTAATTAYPTTTTTTQEVDDEEGLQDAAHHTTTPLLHHDVLTWPKVEPQIYKRKSKSIRRFYKQQNDLIDQLQHFYRAEPEASSLGSNDKDPMPVAMAIHASFVLNVILLVVKILASIWSGSMSVIASAADSLLDLLSGSVLVITHRLVANTNQRHQDEVHYPQGKSRMEPIGVFSFAIIMMLSSLQIMIEAMRRLISRPDIALGPFTLSILAFTIVSKALASWYCRKVSRMYQSSTAAAYADDHRNDVLTNTFGVAAALCAVYYEPLWFLDSVGAIGIAIYIITCWFHTGNEQLQFLTGRGASPLLLQQLTYIAAHHDERIQYVDTVRAYHFGVRYLVEIDIVLPPHMPLRETHDIGESLQHRLEELEQVERAFVHNDYEWDHSPVVFRGQDIIRK